VNIPYMDPMGLFQIIWVIAEDREILKNPYT